MKEFNLCLSDILIVIFKEIFVLDKFNTLRTHQSFAMLTTTQTITQDVIVGNNIKWEILQVFQTVDYKVASHNGSGYICVDHGHSLLVLVAD